MRLLRLILYAGSPGQVEQKCPVLGAEIKRVTKQAYVCSPRLEAIMQSL